MNTIILFTTFLFFHHQILAIYALTCPTFQEIAVRLPNGQKFALLLPKSFVETKIAIFFYGTNLSLLFIKIEHIQNCFVCNKSLNTVFTGIRARALILFARFEGGSNSSMGSNSRWALIPKSLF